MFPNLGLGNQLHNTNTWYLAYFPQNETLNKFDFQKEHVLYIPFSQIFNFVINISKENNLNRGGFFNMATYDDDYKGYINKD